MYNYLFKPAFSRKRIRQIFEHFYNNLFLALKYMYVSSAFLTEKFSSLC